MQEGNLMSEDAKMCSQDMKGVKVEVWGHGDGDGVFLQAERRNAAPTMLWLSR
jgi:sarcosine oxidase delta subunit